ncbi:uncharacterized protein LOC130701110 [Daphnia carinata]|uniref:uncharacterized protein LOC130701110 n=1 Tax=Daphnia carinata TaxID=120202 RepID=UPI0028695E4D|nr:uncharacterized protein LOC130701110 [Daphnia carinata]
MARLLRVHVTVFAVFLAVYSPVNGISNIFKNFPPLFDLTLSSNDTSTNIVNVTVRQDTREICIPLLLLHGSVDPVKSEYKSQDVIRIICKDGYELENSQSSLLYCSQKGVWQVFTLGDSIYIPLPRCIAKKPCPPLPALMRGSMQIEEGGVSVVTSELSSTRAVYECWYGLELEPPESEIRYCVRGKWTGENPSCVPASCPRPPTVTGGFFVGRGVVNNVYGTGATAKYYCDEGHRQKGPPLLTCSGKEWTPKDLPACVPIESSANGASSSFKQEARGCPLPPEIANGRYQMLPMRRSFSSSPFSPRIQHWNGSAASGPSLVAPSAAPPTMPVYSSVLYSCHRGFLSAGSSLITCSPGGWWQPTHNAPRCLPLGAASPSAGIHHSYGGNGLEMKENNAGQDGEDKAQGEEQTPGPLLVSFTTACGVTFVLCLIWMASRWKITCLRSSPTGGHRGRQDEQTLSISAPVCHPATSAPHGGRRHQPSLWTWISPNHNDRPAHHRVHDGDDDSLPAYDRQLLDLGQTSDQDRVALIAYMNDSNTSSQATLPSYEEAVRSGTSSAATATISSVYCTWPVAPPSYDSILILDEANGAATTASHHLVSQSVASPSIDASCNISFVQSDEAAAGTTRQEDNDQEADAVDGGKDLETR